MPDPELSTLPGEQETIPVDSATVSPADTVPEAEEPGSPEQEAEQTEDASEGEQPEAAKPEKKPLDWKDRRRIEETNKRRAIEAENERLRKELESLRKGAAPASATTTQDQSPDDIRRAAVDEARRQIEAEQGQKAFQEATGRVLNNGIAAYPDFDAARQEMVQNFGDQLAQRRDFFDAITSLDNGHDVFYALAKDPEQTEQLLSMDPVKMAIKIGQMGVGAAKPAAKPISKAPAPVRPIGGTPQVSTRLEDESAPMDAWASTYLKSIAKLSHR